MLDAVYPPPASVAGRWIGQYGVHGWGVYIGGPYLSPNTWTPDLVREYVRAGVSGLCPIYVGQQAGPDFVYGDFGRGTDDGDDAVRLARDWGWSRDRYLFLDVESETVDSGAGIRDYVTAWCDTVRGAGLWPGVYCPPRFVPELVGTACAYVWVSAWVASGLVYGVHPDSAPGVRPDLWPRHRLWQYASGSLEGYSVDFSAYNHWLDGPPA